MRENKREDSHEQYGVEERPEEAQSRVFVTDLQVADDKII